MINHKLCYVSLNQALSCAAQALLLQEQIGDQAAQPLVCLVVVITLVPVLLDLELRERDRRLDQPYVGVAGKGERQPPRHRYDHVGLRHDDRDRHEVGDGQCDAATQALLGKGCLDRGFMSGAGGGDHRVAQRRELFRGQRAPGLRMVNLPTSPNASSNKRWH